MKPSGADHLRASIKQFRRFIQAQPRQQMPDDPQPGTQWEQQTDERLASIEQKLADQNRLLLIGVVTIVGEIVYRVSVK